MEKIIISSNNENQRADKFLKRYLPSAGTGFLYRMLREKKIKLNGRRCNPGDLLKEGDELSIYFSDETLNKFKSASKESSIPDYAHKTDAEAVRGFEERIVYEDNAFVIINKPAGMLSQKADKKDVSACELLIAYMMSKNEVNDDDLRIYRPSAVNRLDRNTSGLLICAKTLRAAQVMSQHIKHRSLKKEYICLVRGTVTKEKTLDSFIKKDKRSNTVTVSAQREQLSKETGAVTEKIRTYYRPLGREKEGTLLLVELITGKTHQIRAQMASAGHPIAGDPKYGDIELNKMIRQKYGLARQFLHAFRLVFPADENLPEGLSGRTITADLPADLAGLVKETDLSDLF